MEMGSKVIDLSLSTNFHKKRKMANKENKIHLFFHMKRGFSSIFIFIPNEMKANIFFYNSFKDGKTGKTIYIQREKLFSMK